MSQEGELRHRFLLIGRALYLGTLWGVALGEGTLAVWSGVGLLSEVDLESKADVGALIAGALIWAVLFFPISGVIGGVVGGGIALTAGLALALSGRRVIRQMYRARLVAGSVAAAVPLAFFLDRPRSTLWYVLAAGVAAVAALTAVLLTPRIVNGPPPPRNAPVPSWTPPQPPMPPLESELSAAGTQEPRWLIVGRAMSWGVLGGAALGALCWTVVRWGSDEFTPMTLLWLALGGAVLGAGLGFTAGLAGTLNASEEEQSGARLG